MKKKIIGISARFANVYNQDAVKINLSYIEKLNKEDIIPLILTPSNNFEDELNMCDGFLIIGGDDINPKCYNENNDLGFSHDINDQVDEMDRMIITHAYNNKKPTLGICRGLQVMGAFLNGSLYQDLNFNNINHPMLKDKMHKVTKLENFGLNKLLPNEFIVNTFHHQAINKVPEGFGVLLKNGDTIEAIEHYELPLIGVQWHPERLDSDESSIIFKYFLDKFNN